MPRVSIIRLFQIDKLFLGLLLIAAPLSHAEDHGAAGATHEETEQHSQTPSPKSSVGQALAEIVARKQLLFRYYGDTARTEYYEHLAELEPGRESQIKSLIFSGRKKLEEGDEQGGHVDLIKAVNAITKKLEMEPREKSLFSMRSIANEALGKYDEAYKDLEMVIKLTPRNVDPMVKLSNFVRLQNLENKRKFERN